MRVFMLICLIFVFEAAFANAETASAPSGPPQAATPAAVVSAAKVAKEPKVPDRTHITISAITMALPNPDEDAPRAPKAENIARAKAFLEVAGERHSDIALLPELFGTKRTTNQAEAEDLGGPVTSMMAEEAKKHHMYVLGSVYVKRNGKVYNSVPIFDREGKLVGAYDKVHLPDEEAGVCSPGEAFPAFKTDFGTIGVIVCWDMHFPEAARCVALAGAEIIFWPTMYGGKTASIPFAQARAMEDKVFVATADYTQSRGGHVGFTGVVAPDGKVLVENTRDEGVYTAVVNLDDRPKSPDLNRERQPVKYGRITEK